MGGGSETLIVNYQKNIGALCACDSNGVGSQYVQQDKVIVDIPETNGGG